MGRWGGVQVRLHVFFLLFAAVTLYLSWLTPVAGQFDWMAPLSLALLLGSVLIHELGHHQVASRLGGGLDPMVIVPWGGLAPLRPPLDPRAEFFAHLAGPLANLVACFVLLPGLISAGVEVAGLLPPLQPRELTEGSFALVVLKLAFWINWLLLLVNLIPAYPFDGGRALRAGLVAWTPPSVRRFAGVAVIGVSQFAAVGLFVSAWFAHNVQTQGLVPVWFALVLLGIFLLFSAKQELAAQRGQGDLDDLFGYDFSKGFAGRERPGAAPESPPAAKPPASSVWAEPGRDEAVVAPPSDMGADEERRVDEILARLHERGMDSLSKDDRDFLQRASARYRNRLGHRA